MSLDTLVVSARLKNGPPVDPVVPPIYHTTTYRFATVSDYSRSDENREYVYARDSNPTTAETEHVINLLENGQGCLLFNSGMAAISTVFLSFLKSGDHVVMQKPTYFGLELFAATMLSKLNVQVSHVSAGSSASEFKDKIQANTKLLYGESPCNPNLSIIDLEEFGKLGQDTGIVTVVDGTFASPYVQRTLQNGVDISIHSCTKYLGGHSDVLAGCVTTSSQVIHDQIREARILLGNILNAHSSSLLLRGLKTLALRMTKHCDNALKIAQFLELHPKVSKVLYPGLTSHPQHETAKKQMSGFGGIITIELKGGRESALAVLESVQLIELTVSVGGVTSNMEHPLSMSRGYSPYLSIPRSSEGISQGCVRLSAGIEDPDDLIRDLTQALDKAP